MPWMSRLIDLGRNMCCLSALCGFMHSKQGLSFWIILNSKCWLHCFFSATMPVIKSHHPTSFSICISDIPCLEDFIKSSVLIFESIFPLWHLLGGYFHLLNVSVIHVWCIDVRQGLCSFYDFAGTLMPDCGKLCEAGFCLLNNSSWGWWWWSVVTMLTLRHLRLDVSMGCSPSREGQGWMKMRAGLSGIEVCLECPLHWF